MRLKSLVMGVAASAIAVTGTLSTAATVAAEELYIPSLSYRTGPFAGGGIPFANGFADYLNMLNARDGGIGGIKVKVEECETGYNAQKGVECYEATKGKGALVYNPLSTGITLQLIPKAPVDQIPVLSMGYGLSAAAIGEKFPMDLHLSDVLLEPDVFYPEAYRRQWRPEGQKRSASSILMLVTVKSLFHCSISWDQSSALKLRNSLLASKRCRARVRSG